MFKQNIRLSGYQAIRFFILLVLNLSFVICNLSFAEDAPRFYGPEVVVTAAKIPQQKDKSPWDTSIISRQELENYTNVGEVLHTAAGIDSISYGSLGALDSIRLRGANSTQVLVLIDGRRINSPTLGMFDMGDLLTDNVERIEIVKAPLSALYGSDAISGVVNIITRVPDKPERSFSALGGSFGAQQYKLSAGNGNFTIAADSLSSTGYRQNGDYRAVNVFGKAKFPVPSGKIIVDYNYYDAKKGVSGVPTSDADPYSASEPNDRQSDKNVMASIGLVNDNFNLRFYQNSLAQRLDPYVFGASNNEALQTGLEWSQTWGSLLFGLEGREDHGNNTMSGNHMIQNSAAYIQDSIELGKVSLDIGIRGDNHSVVGSSFNPRAGLVYQAGENLFLRASAGSAFRAPTLNELYWNDGWMFGNVNLKPERSASYDLGIERQLTDRTNARLTYFSSTISDQILWVFDNSTFLTNATNLGEVYSEGVEFELTRKIGSDGKGFINYTYQKATDRKDSVAARVGKEIPYTPRNKYNVGLVMGGASAIIRYVGERYGDTMNTQKLAAYTVVDLRLSKNLGLFDLTLAADNLFDERYSEVVGNDPTTFAYRNYPMPGRRFSVGVKCEL